MSEINNQPLVSIVTPVYNGERHLTEAIESVLAQTYDRWEYVILNNASRDRTPEIARHFAAQDDRIRVVHNAETLTIMANWNHALRQISPESRYCKVLHADDLLFPDCLAQMVAVAEAHPQVGVISAYRLNGDRVDLNGIPYPTPVVSGKTVCRWSLLKPDFFVFGSPSSLLLRADLVRKRDDFYSSHIYADVEACYDLLRESDFGFVHQVLTYTRLHEGSQTQSHASLSKDRLGRLTVLMKYGPYYLTKGEYQQRLKQRLDHYYRFLGRSLLERKEPAFWDYHRRWLSELNLALSRSRLYQAAAKELVSQTFLALARPRATLQGKFDREKTPGVSAIELQDNQPRKSAV